MRAFIIALVFFVAALAGSRHAFNEYIPMKVSPGPGISPKPVFTNDLPTSLDWRNVNGINYVTPILNQHVPVYCGSCWAHGALSALSDRVKISRKAAFPDIVLSPQTLLNRGDAGSCHGGSHHAAYSWGHTDSVGFVDQTCQWYQAADNTLTKYKDAKNMEKCYSCSMDFDDPSAKCTAVANFTHITVADFGSVSGEKDMIAQLQNGPIACGVGVDDTFEYFTGGPKDVLSGSGTWINHIISVVGYTTIQTEKEGNVNVWIVRNSWGQGWGNSLTDGAAPTGFGYVRRGANAFSIEEDCAWAVPKIHM